MFDESALMKFDSKNSKEIKSIISLFIQNVRGKDAPLSILNGHDGVVGHHLESLFGIQKNNKSEADFGAYELKKNSPKISLWDLTPNIGEYDIGKVKTKDGRLNKTLYLERFGVVNEEGKAHVTGPFYFSKAVKDLKLIIENNHLILRKVSTNQNIIGWDNILLTKHLNKKFKSGIATVSMERKKFIDLNFYPGLDLKMLFQLIREDKIIYDPGTSIKKPYSQIRLARGLKDFPSRNYRDFLINKNN